MGICNNLFNWKVNSVKQLLITFDSTTLDLLLDDFLDDCNDPFCWVFLDNNWDGEAELDSGVEFNKGFKELGPLTVMIHGSSKSLSFLPESSLK